MKRDVNHATFAVFYNWAEGKYQALTKEDAWKADLT